MRFFSFIVVGLLLYAPSALAFPTVPLAASAMGQELDRQVVEHLNQAEPPAQGVSLLMTTPVSINNLDEANPLARQMEEELARWFVQAGYPVQEIRKGAELLFDPATGEMLLTRDATRLGTNSPCGAAVLVGTYAVTSRSVRFNIRLVQTTTQTVLAMSSATVPLNGEARSLLHDADAGAAGAPLEPTVYTRLP